MKDKNKIETQKAYIKKLESDILFFEKELDGVDKKIGDLIQKNNELCNEISQLKSQLEELENDAGSN